MSSPDSDTLSNTLVSTSERDATIEALANHFSVDRLSEEDYEKRVDIVHQSKTRADLKRAMADLPILQLPAQGETSGSPATQSSSSAVMVATDTLERQSLARIKPKKVPLASLMPEESRCVTVLGQNGLNGVWRPASEIAIVCVLGEMKLDFRQAYLLPGITMLKVVSVLGSVEIIVPPDVVVQTNGTGVLGEISNKSEESEIRDDTKVLSVQVTAVLGEVKVRTQRVGESEKDARKRYKALKKADKKALRSARS